MDGSKAAEDVSLADGSCICTALAGRRAKWGVSYPHLSKKLIKVINSN